jgi:hypothetical protein
LREVSEPQVVGRAGLAHSCRHPAWVEASLTVFPEAKAKTVAARGRASLPTTRSFNGGKAASTAH